MSVTFNEIFQSQDDQRIPEKTTDEGICLLMCAEIIDYKRRETQSKHNTMNGA